MPNVTYISHTGETTTIDAPVGTTVMENAVKNGIEGIVGECGGACLCATCHVYVDPSWTAKTGEHGELEASMLDIACNLQPNSRLSCQLVMTPAMDGLVVEMPETQT